MSAQPHSQAAMHMQLFDALLKYSVEAGATDLHLCAGSSPVMRLRSSLVTLPGTDRVMPEMTLSVTKGLLTEKQFARLEEDKTLDFSFSRTGLGRFRSNIYSQRGTYAIALRALPFEIPKLSSLGLPPALAQFTQRSRGLILATGATGSGKSTTLAALLDVINEQNAYHIITIEDPLEYLHRHKKSLVTQREIGEDAPSFASALRAALREDPDVIMVGEMRDAETISIALTAAETGHLVLSTLHTVGAAKSIDRIIDAFQAGQQNQVRAQLSAVLEGVISQQLIPRQDKGGIVPACEVMVVNPAIRNLIREGKHYQINSVMQTGQAQGMQLLEMDIARLAKSGIISMEEAQMRAQDSQLLQQFLARR